MTKEQFIAAFVAANWGNPGKPMTNEQWTEEVIRAWQLFQHIAKHS